ncbi:MAG TPA: diguanylate cyclase [Bryobacteraceae bacterium]|jgi:GGDEF domain-containing protein
MPSFRKFWTPEDPANDADLGRAVRLLMQGIPLCAVEGDPADYQKFRQEMQKLLDAVEATPSTVKLVESAGSTLKTLEDYNRRTTRYVRMQGAELQHMITMLTRTVAELESGSQKAAGRLRGVETKLETLLIADDVRALKLCAVECLIGIRQEAEELRLESAHTSAALKQRIHGTQDHIRNGGGAPAPDPSTGLRGRSAAIAAMGEAALTPEPGFAALFIVDGVVQINSQLGYAAGDQILKFYMEELHRRLPIADQLFRWSGPAFLALLSRSEPIEEVREHLGMMAPRKLERTLDLADRTAPVSISASWAVFPVALPIDEVIARLDRFLSTPAPAVAV